MANPPKKKGTAFETELVPSLRKVWPEAKRSEPKGALDFGDYENVNGWYISAKKAERWSLMEWIRTVLKQKLLIDPTAPWFIVFANDRRKGLPTMVAMPLEQYIGALERLRWLQAELESRGE